MFEHRSQPIISRKGFISRLLRHLATSLGLIFISLGVGVIGYHEMESMNWVDSFVNAAMLMGGMGPVGELQTPSGKLFAGIYALYCGLVFVIAAGIIFLPFIHRLLHKFHIKIDEE